MTVEEIVADVTGRLHRAGIPYAVGGSLASSIWGQMRNTNDADIAIRLAIADIPSLKAGFGDPYHVSEAEIREVLSTSGDFRTVQLLHMDEAFKIDLFLLSNGAYETSELERARAIEISPGTTVRFSAPENIILAKLRGYLLGNRVSDRQWNDIVHVLEVQRGKLDDAYLDEWAAHFAVDDLLKEAQSQAFS